LTTRPKPTATLLLLLSLSGATCESTTKPSGPQPQQLSTVKLTLNNRAFTLQVADDENEQQMGLMYRDSMPGDHGMIFVFPWEEQRSFWMKNTRIPLDIIYLDKHATIVSIKQMKPFDLSGVPSDKPAQYAIELNEGMAKAIGLKVGDKIDLPAEITQRK
jgi:uncharacterized membrane protein (UPF0127 family)